MLRRTLSTALAGLLGACLVHEASAGSGSFSLLEWSAAWSFRDDFEDGDFADGSSGETRLYTQLCGTVSDADENAGRLRLEGPEAVCGIALRARMPAVAIPRASMRLAPETFPLGTRAGLEVASQDGAHSALLSFGRRAVPGLGADTLAVDLIIDSSIFFAGAVMSLDPVAALATDPVVDLELAGALEPGGLQWKPTARVRICAAPGCDDATPWIDLLVNPAVEPGQVLFPMNEVYEPYLFAQGATPFVVDLDEWSWATSYADDFEDGAFGATLPYYADCPVAEQSGALVLDPFTGVGCSSGTPTFLTGEASARATFAWSLPRACTYGVGIEWSTDANVFARDGALARVVRAPLPGIGDDVLFVGVWSEIAPSGPFGLLVLSTDPASDPALADTAAIELALSIEDAGPTFSPRARARLCDAVPCPSESAVPFVELAEYAVPQIQGGLICGIPVVAWAPPSDGGALTNVPHAVGVYVAPEPASVLLGALALAAIAWLSRIAA